MPESFKWQLQNKNITRPTAVQCLRDIYPFFVHFERQALQFRVMELHISAVSTSGLAWCKNGCKDKRVFAFYVLISNLEIMLSFPFPCHITSIYVSAYLLAGRPFLCKSALTFSPTCLYISVSAAVDDSLTWYKHKSRKLSINSVTE